jgi:hypothetical protein
MFRMISRALLWLADIIDVPNPAPSKPFVDYFADRLHAPPDTQNETRVWVNVKRRHYEDKYRRKYVEYHLYEGYGIDLVRAKSSSRGKTARIKAVGGKHKSRQEIINLVSSWFSKS